jgi:hypothetical protein
MADKAGSVKQAQAALELPKKRLNEARDRIEARLRKQELEKARRNQEQMLIKAEDTRVKALKQAEALGKRLAAEAAATRRRAIQQAYDIEKQVKLGAKQALKRQKDVARAKFEEEHKAKQRAELVTTKADTMAQKADVASYQVIKSSLEKSIKVDERVNASGLEAILTATKKHDAVEMALNKAEVADSVDHQVIQISAQALQKLVAMAENYAKAAEAASKASINASQKATAVAQRAASDVAANAAKVVEQVLGTGTAREAAETAMRAAEDVRLATEAAALRAELAAKSAAANAAKCVEQALGAGTAREAAETAMRAAEDARLAAEAAARDAEDLTREATTTAAEAKSAAEDAARRAEDASVRNREALEKPTKKQKKEKLALLKNNRALEALKHASKPITKKEAPKVPPDRIKADNSGPAATHTGMIKLSVALTGADSLHNVDFENSLRNIPDVRLLMVSGTNRECVQIFVSSEKFVALPDILRRLPMVEQITERPADILIKLKPDSILVSKI